MITDNRSSAKVTFVLVALAFVVSHLHFILLPDIFYTWDQRTSDQLFVLRNQSKKFMPAYNPRVVHVDLTNSSVDALDQFYFNRGHFARVITNLKAMNTGAQMWDFILAAKENEAHDKALIDATAQAGNVYFGMALTLDPPGAGSPASETVPPFLADIVWHPVVEGSTAQFFRGHDPLPTFSELTMASRGTGSLSVNFDGDGVLRRVPMLVHYGDGYAPVLPLRVACDVLKIDTNRIVVVPGEHIILPDAVMPDTGDKQDIRIPIDDHGNMVVNFIGPWERMTHYNIADILLASEERDLLEMWGEELRGKLVVVSDLSTGSADIGTIPGDSAYPLGGVHANIMHSILTGSFITEVGPAGTAAMEIAMLLLIWLMSLAFASVAFSIGSLVVGLGIVAVAVTGFIYGNLLIHIVQPLQMLAFAVGAILIYRYVTEERAKLEGLRQRDEVRSTFGRYLSNEVVEQLMSSPEGRNLGGENRVVTFLVSDLRGFTSMAAGMAPETVIDILNRFLERMVSVITHYGGTVDEIQGDGILVFFGAPLQDGDEEKRAVACAVEMQNALIDFNDEQQQKDLPTLEMGIAIHTGEVVVGNIGSEARAKYGAVGSAINTAFRIESHTVGGQIFVSSDTHAALGNTAEVRDRMDIQFKGLDTPLTIYDVVGFSDDSGPVLKQSKDASVTALAEPVAVRCHVVDGKEIRDDAINGIVTAAGESSLVLDLDTAVPHFTNLKIISDESIAGLPMSVYGKVTGAATDTSSFRITITSTGTGSET